ncbi:hypothetical protein [Microbacterium jejuense]|uniref:hypothetical protein n=1 Tax=Microbacterium jejuense TaxID=1263637 RepID=UPI0031EADB17
MARALSDKPRLLHSAGFGLLGEMLLVGILVAVCLLPAVTALAGLAAGTRHLRRHIAGEGDGIRLLLDDLRIAMKGLLLPGVVLVAALLAVAFDVWLLSFVEAPGEAAVRLVLLAAGLAAVLIAVRLAARWAPGMPLRPQLRAAAAVTWRDPVGTLLLAAAVGAPALFVWMYPPLLVVSGGLVALAGVGVEMRRASRAEPPAGG